MRATNQATDPAQKPLPFSARPAVSDSRPYEPFVPGPNPKLPEFIAQHAIPYDPEHDDYDVPAFDRDLIVDKAAPPKAIYDMHTYWSKKHWAAIREYIRHYLPEKYYTRGTGLVLDCFAGSGMTGVAAMMEDRPCVLIDASPAAAFISHCYTHPVDPEELRAAYEQMMTEPYPETLREKLKKITGETITNLAEELDWLYATRCDRCGGKATTEYVVYSERFQCPNCAEVVPLFDCPEEKVPYPVGGKKALKTELKKRRVCPYCLAKSRGNPHRDFVISTRTKKFGPVPVLVRYRCEEGCKPATDERRHDDDHRTRKGKYFKEYDLAKLDQIEKAEIPHWYPKRKMMDVEDDTRPWGVKWRAGTASFRSVAEFYTKRNLWALASLCAALAQEPKRQPLNLVITASCMWLSRMNQHRPDSSFKTGILKGTYYIPPINQDQSVSVSLPGKFQTILRSQESLHATIGSLVGMVATSQQSAAPAILDEAQNYLDFIFTDPPYLNIEAQYGELNFVWESWLGFESSWFADEIVVNPFREKSIEDWDRDMRQVLKNCLTGH